MDPSVLDEFGEFNIQTSSADDDVFHFPGLSGKFERWQTDREKNLGKGSQGAVWKQRCVEGLPINCIRAVKEVPDKEKLVQMLSRRELQALFTFSDPMKLEVRLLNPPYLVRRMAGTERC